MATPGVVDRLVLAALNAMEEVQLEQDFDEKAILLAAYTVCLRVTDAAIARNEETRLMCLAAAQLLMARCEDGSPRQKN
jgi:hypothetical protein